MWRLSFSVSGGRSDVKANEQEQNMIWKQAQGTGVGNSTAVYFPSRISELEVSWLSARPGSKRTLDMQTQSKCKCASRAHGTLKGSLDISACQYLERNQDEGNEPWHLLCFLPQFVEILPAWCDSDLLRRYYIWRTRSSVVRQCMQHTRNVMRLILDLLVINWGHLAMFLNLQSLPE